MESHWASSDNPAAILLNSRSANKHLVKSSRALSSDEAVRPLQQFERILQDLLPGLSGPQDPSRALPSGRLVVPGMRQPQLQKQDGLRQHPLPNSDTEAGRLALPGMRQLQLVLQASLQFEGLLSSEGARRSGGGEASVASRSPPVLSRLHGVPLFRHQHTIAAKHHALPTISSVQVSIHRDSVARRQHCACHQTCPALLQKSIKITCSMWQCGLGAPASLF